MIKLKELENGWNDYSGSMKKSEILLDQIAILSLREIADGIFIFRKIEPEILSFPRTKLSSGKISNLPSWALQSIQKVGAAFKVNGELLIPDPMILKSISDLFGLNRVSLEPGIWRDFHLAALFREVSDANISVRARDGYNVLAAIHRSKLDAIDVSLIDIVKKLIDKKEAHIDSWGSDKIRFEVRLILPNEKNGSKMVLTVRDSDIGRESLTFFTGWMKNGGIVYVNELKKRHRTSATMETILKEVDELINETMEKTLPARTNCNIKNVVESAKNVLGKAKIKRFKAFLASQSPFKEAEDILFTAATYEDSRFYDDQQTRLRFCLGELIKGEA